MEVKGEWGLLHPPCLLITVVPCSPPSQLKRSFAGVIWMCRASFTNSSCPLPWSSMVVSSQWIRWWFSHTCSVTAAFPQLFQKIGWPTWWNVEDKLCYNTKKYMVMIVNRHSIRNARILYITKLSNLCDCEIMGSIFPKLSQLRGKPGAFNTCVTSRVDTT